MPRLSPKSLANLESCHPHLRVLFKQVAEVADISILCGERTKEKQNKLFEMGRSQLKFPHSYHNHQPSWAVDVAPWIPGHGIPWTEASKFRDLYSIVEKIDTSLNIKKSLTWGGHWSNFRDYAHYELSPYTLKRYGLSK